MFQKAEVAGSFSCSVFCDSPLLIPVCLHPPTSSVKLYWAPVLQQMLWLVWVKRQGCRISPPSKPRKKRVIVGLMSPESWDKCNSQKHVQDTETVKRETGMRWRKAIQKKASSRKTNTGPQASHFLLYLKNQNKTGLILSAIWFKISTKKGSLTC